MECGLALLWREVVDPVRSAPSWLFEHAKGGWIAALVRTWVGALRPSSFWSVVRLAFIVRPGRLALLSLIFLFAAYLSLVASHAYVVGSAATRGLTRASLPKFAQELTFLPEWALLLVGSVWPPSLRGRAADEALGSSPWFTLAVVMWCVMPLAFLTLPTTLGRCQVRFGHLVRIGVHAMAMLPLLCLLDVVLSLLVSSEVTWLWNEPGVAELLFQYHGIFPLACGAWLALTWYRACALYLRLPDARRVVAAMLVVSFLAGLVVTSYVHPRAMMNPVTRAIFR